MGTVAAQVVAAIAHIELPRNEWTDLLPTILPTVAAEEPTTKRAALQAIGFICEVLDPNILQAQSNAILTAVAEGARKDQTRLQTLLTKAIKSDSLHCKHC